MRQAGRVVGFSGGGGFSSGGLYCSGAGAPVGGALPSLRRQLARRVLYAEPRASRVAQEALRRLKRTALEYTHSNTEPGS